MNEGHEAGSDAIKVKKNKKTDFKTLNIHSAIQWERERERERLKNLEELREGRTAGAGAGKQRVNGQRQISDEWPIYRWGLQISDRAPEVRSRGRSPICDEGRASTATTSELRRRGDVTVGLLGFCFYLCIGDFFFFFFLDKNLCFSVFLSVALCLICCWLSVSLVCCWVLGLISSIGSIGHWGCHRFDFSAALPLPATWWIEILNLCNFFFFFFRLRMRGLAVSELLGSPWD